MVQLRLFLHHSRSRNEMLKNPLIAMPVAMFLSQLYHVNIYV